MEKINNRPKFPKRAVVTNGMPYGDKPLHFGHVGGGFVHSDIYARFLRDRIGAENVIYVSGTDCYGAGPVVKHKQAVAAGEFSGGLREFTEHFHLLQKEVLDAYGISLDNFAASAQGDASVHERLSREFFEIWYNAGLLRAEEAEQFFDGANILNGRQVEGRCPIAKCKSDKAYADECELGHQYSPRDLIAPKVTETGAVPTLAAVKNWYFDLERFGGALKKMLDRLTEEGISRRFLLSNITDFLKPPAILIKTDDFDTLWQACAEMPEHRADYNEEKSSAALTFALLKDREAACVILRGYGIRYRTGTTLVPFRLSGNVEWGIPVPERDGIANQTFWVWPESLWAPISFVQDFLDNRARQIKSSEASATRVSDAQTAPASPDLFDAPSESWTDWWLNEDAKVYQFIGEDNIYFYAVAEMGLLFALADALDLPRVMPVIIPNRHVFFGNRKASSSGEVKPPEALQLLEHYTPEQLRMHFAHMALHTNSAKFMPKALTGGEGFDATLAEGNILTNVYNRLVRSCFYSLQKYFGGRLPDCAVSPEARAKAETAVSEYEWAMYRFEFAKIIDQLDVFLREANKSWAASTKAAQGSDEDTGKLTQLIVDFFYIVRICAVLLHPFAPFGTEMVREYLGFGEEMWDWAHILEPPEFFMRDGHSFKFLEPRVDFFAKHPSQL